MHRADLSTCGMEKGINWGGGGCKVNRSLLRN